MKVDVFWFFASCSLVKFADVSDVLAAFVTNEFPIDGGSKQL
jgi:hypothetical protein